MSWLESLVYGLLSGLAEFLPISAQAHRALFLKLTGTADTALIRLAVHLGALVALLIACAPIVSRLNRERRIAAIPLRRRKRQPDTRSLLDIRILKTAGIGLLVCFLAYPLVRDLHERLWVLAILLGINGILLYIPQYLPGANKDSLSLSALDALLIGFGAGTGVLPGISRIGASVSVGLIRGTDRRYILDTALLLSVPGLIVLSVIDCTALILGAGGITFLSVLYSVLAGAAALGGASLAIFIMRFLAFKAGFSGFAYYSWGTALFAFILYLTI